MSRKISYLKFALLDLDSIKNYISINSNYSGIDFVNELVNYLDDLLVFPNLGVDFDLKTKKLVYKKYYCIYYEVTDLEIIILRVIDVRRNLF